MPKTRQASSKSPSGSPSRELSAARLSQWTEDYRRAVEREWSLLRLNETDVPLSEVYVMLHALDSSTTGGPVPRTEVAELPERLAHAGIRSRKEPAAAVGLAEALGRAPHVLLLGEPGSGKSTTLQFIGLCLVHLDWAASRLQLEEALIPVKLDLRKYVSILSSPGPALETALWHEVQEFVLGLRDEQAADLVYAWIEQGRLLALLDGLDEVPEDARRLVRQHIQGYVARLSGHECRLIVSSRLAGYSPLGADFREFTLKPFEDEGEAVPYLQCWLAAFRRDWTSEQAREQAERLHEQMRLQPALQRVLDNPLLLRLAAQVYAREGNISGSRAGLYAHYVEDLWMRATEQRGLSPAAHEPAWSAAQTLAWDLQMGRPAKLAREDEHILREQMGLVVRSGDQLVFGHTTLQEYFAAQRLKEAWCQDEAAAWAFLRPRLHVPAWREPLLLLCGLLDARQAGRLTARVLDARSLAERRLHRDAFLAARLIAENNAISGETRGKAIRGLVQLLYDEAEYARSAAEKMLVELRLPESVAELCGIIKSKPSWELRARTVELLRQIELPTVVAELVRLLEDEDEDIRAVAAGALRDMRPPEAAPALIRALRDENPFVRERAASALGELKEAAAVPELMERLATDENQGVRWNAADALGEIGAAEAVPCLLAALHDKDDEVRAFAAGALGQCGAREAIPQLIEALHAGDRPILYGATRSLGLLHASEAVPELIAAIQIPEPSVQGEAIAALGLLRAPAAVPALAAVLREGESGLQSAAASALGEIGTAEAASALLEELRTESTWQVSDALVHFKPANVMPALLTASQHDDPSMRAVAADVLGSVEAPESVPALLHLLQDENEEVRLTAIRALGRKTAPEAVQALGKVLRDTNSDVQDVAVWTFAGKSSDAHSSAARALADTGSPQAVGILLQALRHGDKAAKWALEKMQAPEVTPGLIRLLRDREGKVRCTAIDLLREKKAVEAVPELRRLVHDADAEVRREAIYALTDLQAREALPDLIDALRDGDVSVRHVAANALEKLPAAEAVPNLAALLQKEGTGPCRAAIAALAATRTPQARAELIGALRHQAEDVRIAAACALAQNGWSEGAGILIRALEEAESPVRGSAAEALARIPTPAAVPGLIHVLQGDEQSWVRRNAAQALGEIKDASAAPALVEALKDEYQQLRWNAAWALGQIGAPEVVPALLEALEDEDVYVCQRAAESLGEVRSPELMARLLKDMLDEKKRKSSLLAVAYIVDGLSSAEYKEHHREYAQLFYALLEIGLSEEQEAAVAARLAALETSISPHQDPFEPPGPSPVVRGLRWILVALCIVLLLGLLAVTGTLLGATQDALKTIIGAGWLDWIRGNLWIGLLVLTALGALSGLLAWEIDRLKKRLPVGK